MSISQIQLSRPGIDISLPSLEASSGSDAGNALQQIALLVLEQVVHALQDKLSGNAASSGNPEGLRSATGPGIASGAGGSSAGFGPEGLLERFADLFKGLGESTQKSLDEQRANQFAQKLAQTLGSDPKTLDQLDDGQANGSFNDLATSLLPILGSPGVSSSGNDGSASGASGPAGTANADGDASGGIDDLIKQLLQLLQAGDLMGADGLAGKDASGNKQGSAIDKLSEMIGAFTQMLQSVLKGNGSQDDKAGGSESDAGSTSIAGGVNPAAGGVPPGGGASRAGSAAYQLKQLLDDFSKGDTRGATDMARNGHGQDQLNQILDLLMSLQKRAGNISGGENSVKEIDNGGGTVPGIAGVPAATASSPYSSPSSAPPASPAPAQPGIRGPSEAGSSPGTPLRGQAPEIRSTDPGKPLNSTQMRELQELLKPDSVDANGVGVYDKTRVIPSGVHVDFNGARIKAGQLLGAGDQAEGQKELIRMESGSSVANLELSGADGIHAMGDAKLDRVKWADVGEDAFTMKGPGNVQITNSSAFNADDKIFQLNAGGSFKLDNFTADTFGKAVRTNGGKDFPIDISVTNSSFTNGKEAVVRSDATQANIRLSGNTLTHTPNDVIAPERALVEGAQQRGWKAYTG